ncbi:unnamed protein product [Hapterophycus canaliculatus]
MASRMLARSGVAAARRVVTPASAGARRSASNLKPVDQNKAYFLNLGPHYKREGWEGIMAVTWVASAGILIIGLGYGPETGIKEWARDEALARNVREAKGLPVEYGQIYSQEPRLKYTFTSAEDDDEEEDEDDDEDDEEEEE